AGWVRGQGVFNDQSPDFSKDFSATSADIEVPLISHEIGQYSVYPDISEISKYTGNLVATNFMAVRDDLKKKGRLSYAPAFLRASGKLATLLYKEEIERALKTKEFDGFQLLQMQDFPGQGTALVGVLNAFWQPKGFVTAQEFKRFNSPLTPLIRYPKAVYLNDERFVADVELANFLKSLKGTVISWSVKNSKGRLIAGGEFAKQDFGIGNALHAGRINALLNSVTVASQLTVEVTVKGSVYTNSWKIWVYPANLPIAPADIVVTDVYQEAMTALSAGKNVLLSPRTDTLKGIEGRFVPVFWSPVHFPDQPGTMGQLIKSAHRAFQYFPTDEHTDWQWWDLVKNSRTLAIDDLQESAILVRVIDNFVTNGNLTNLFEVQVGKGKLLFSSIDLISNLDSRPQARQLRYSLLQYMQGNDFKPANNVPEEWVRKLIK
ncbi:MAG: glycoside hydrolase family 2, partial [Chitinophagaceae bacterium]|nr:glycoside hydrolase family 2 [Chitinophagaceae bacterium]